MPLDQPSDVPISGTPEWLRTVNDRTALRLIISHGALSRSQLGKLSRMSKPTASLMVARLEKLGLIKPTGVISGSRGPTAVTYGVRAEAFTGVAINMEPNRIEAAVVDPTGTRHPRVELPVPKERSPAGDVQAAVEQACEAAGISTKRCSHVLIAVQGAVNEAADELNFTDTLPGWPRKGACAQIEEETGWKATLDNDANLAAAAEREAGTAGNHEDFIYLWLGTGVGAGLDIDRKTRRGASGSAGEVGYLEIPVTGLVHDPHAKDFTDLLSDEGLMNLTETDSYHAALEALAGSEEYLLAYTQRLQLLVHPLVAVLDPGLIIIGGPTGAKVGVELVALLDEMVDVNVEFACATTGTDAALEGARSRLLLLLHNEMEKLILASA